MSRPDFEDPAVVVALRKRESEARAGFGRGQQGNLAAEVAFGQQPGAVRADAAAGALGGEIPLEHLELDRGRDGPRTVAPKDETPGQLFGAGRLPEDVNTARRTTWKDRVKSN